MIVKYDAGSKRGITICHMGFSIQSQGPIEAKVHVRI